MVRSCVVLRAALGAAPADCRGSVRHRRVAHGRSTGGSGSGIDAARIDRWEGRRVVERSLERLIFASRWLMAPFYLGLVVALAMLLVKFVQELLHYLPGMLAMKESDMVLAVLALVDLTLAGSLVLMVILSGYENFVSKIETSEDTDRPEWMGTLDFSALKLKLVASIVAISAIHLLKAFMNVSAVAKEDVFWLVVIHMAFVVSGVLLALMDWISEKAKGAHG
jgi:uncharacterized protein (TIGR00645 family)